MATTTTTESSTPFVAVTTLSFRLAMAATLLNQSISKIDFVIDSAKPVKANVVAESRITLAKPITTAPWSLKALILSQTPRPATTPITQSYKSVGTNTRPIKAAKADSVAAGIRADKLQSSKHIKSQVNDINVKGLGKK